MKPSPLPPGSSGIASVMMAWSGGAYDTKRDRLIVWGGGHADYSGNEIYAFDVGALKWSRVNEPSADVGGVESTGVYPDGAPRSQHTYNYIQYVPVLDRFCAFGSSGYYPGGQRGSAQTQCFGFVSKQWERKADTKTIGIAHFSAVDPPTGAVWSGKGTLTRFDPQANAWGKQTEYDNDIEWTNYLTLEADPKRRLLVGVGAGKVYRWNISDLSTAIKAYPLATVGGDAVIKAGAPGLAYDPVGERLVAWGGGPDVYSLHPETGVWTRHARTGGATPSVPEANGTYGRFRYVATWNVFILVNRTSENVFLFKLTAGGGTSVGTTATPRPAPASPSVTFRGTRVIFSRNGLRDARGRSVEAIYEKGKVSESSGDRPKPTLQ